MTNHEVLLRLSVDKHDHLAVMSLHDNNAEIIRTTLIRYFGTSTIADNVECALMQRMADHARSYQDPEDPDAWLARCVNTECDRLRNEAIRDEADRD
jgi:predicted RNA polymerase sigma factor